MLEEEVVVEEEEEEREAGLFGKVGEMECEEGAMVEDEEAAIARSLRGALQVSLVWSLGNKVCP